MVRSEAPELRRKMKTSHFSGQGHKGAERSEEGVSLMGKRWQISERGRRQASRSQRETNSPREVSWRQAGGRGRGGREWGRTQACPRADGGRGNLAWYFRASRGSVLVTAPHTCTVTAPSLTIPLCTRPSTFYCRVDSEDLSIENKQKVDVVNRTLSVHLHAALKCGRPGFLGGHWGGEPAASLGTPLHVT